MLTVISTINATTTENSTTQRSVAHQNKVNDLTPVASTNIKDKRTKNSFKDLNDSIVSTTKEVNLTKDYKFDKNSDYNFSRGIRIDNKNLIINGNYHVIDALNMTRIFNINSSNVTINNLILKNSNISSLMVNNSNIITNNVTFINEIDNDNAAAVISYTSNYTSFNDKYIDNNFVRYRSGASIVLVSNSKLTLTNGTFKNKHHISKALISASESNVKVFNTTFTNISSQYSPALYLEKSGGYIKNTQFTNLKANITAGAIGIRNLDDQIIFDNCTFYNVSSRNNGGAIFADIADNDDGEVTIVNSLFDSCSSEIGGAYVQLEGLLTINNTQFKSNVAELSGGAVYTSYANVTILNSSFKDNKALVEIEDYYDGGALFIDKSEELIINNSLFINNHASKAEAILIYDSCYSIMNSYFDGNIYTFFDEEDSKLKNNVFKGKKNVINEKDYQYVYEGKGAEIPLDPIILDEKLVNASYFNLNDYGLVSPVKNQGSMGACWAFGAASSLESALLKATNKKVLLDVSENNIQNLGLKYSLYGDTAYGEGSQSLAGTAYFASWLGVTTVEDDVYDELGKLSPIIDNGSKYYVYDVIFIEPRKNPYDNQRLKEALIKYGAITVGVRGAGGNENYNPETASAYYYNEKWGVGADHSVSLIGWDDNFSRYNFIATPPGDGAWIIKNSWGDKWGKNGFYYVSYYDTVVATSEFQLAIDFKKNHGYERNYEYDLAIAPDFDNNGSDDYEEITYYNRYTAIDDELISAVGTYFNKENEEYIITIYPENGISYTQKGVSSHAGYETIELDKYVGVKANKTFVVKITSNNLPKVMDSRTHLIKGTSIFEEEDETRDLTKDDEVACIKAYTITDKSLVETKNLTTTYNSNKYVQARYYDQNGEKLVNTQVQFIVNNKTYNKTTNNDGIATLDINFPPGTYTVTIINPINRELTNITLTINSNNNNNHHPTKTRNIHKLSSKQVTKNSYKVYVKGNIITNTKYITINMLNNIFNQTFLNGHLVVYIDGVLVFNGTVYDDIYTIIVEITGKLLGQHELKVEFTDLNNDTRTYHEVITIE